MAEQTQSPPAPAPLADSTRAEALKIAGWCETQRASADTGANAQIRVVWMLLLGGLLLLLVLPRLLQEIDFAWQKDSLPPEILKSFEVTEASIESNRAEMESEKAEAEAQLANVTQDLQEQTAESEALVTEITALLDRPYGVWQRTQNLEVPGEFVVNDIAVMRDDEVVVVGRIQDPDNPKDWPNDGVGMVLHRGSRDGVWAVRQPEWNGNRVDFVAAAIAGPDNVYLISVRAKRFGAILASDNLSDWDQIWPSERETIAEIIDIVKAPGGPYVAVGWIKLPTVASETTFIATQLLLSSQDGLNWSEVVVSGEDSAAPGVLDTAHFGTDGFIAAGWRVEEVANVASFLHSSDGLDWRRNTLERLNISQIGGTSRLLARDGQGTVYAPSFNRKVLALAESKGVWSVFEKQFGGVTALTEISDGSVLRFSSSSDRRGDRIEIGVLGSDPKTGFALEADGFFFGGTVTKAVDLGDGRLLAGGSNFLIESLDAGARARFLETVLAEARIPDGVIVAAPPGQNSQRNHTASLVRSLGGVQTRLAALEESVEVRNSVLAAAAQTLARQETIKTDFADLSEELEKTLRSAEPSRQLAQIATRLAVIGLLIYLVQIVVNRYRYMQRLAGFYQARAQAFRLLAASPDAALLQSVTLADVTAMLSPDAIGFDKSAEPPTGQMVSLLQAGLRKT